MAENLSISVKTTAAHSPWSNGVVEGHNAVLSDISSKVKSQDIINL